MNLPVFMLIWDPWCPHCKVWRPEWEALANASVYDGKILFSSLNCATERKLCQQLSPGTSFPRMIWIDSPGSRIRRYTGSHDVPGVIEFIKKQFSGYYTIIKNSTGLESYVSESGKVPSFLFNVTLHDNATMQVIDNVCRNLKHMDVRFGIIADTKRHEPKVMFLLKDRKFVRMESEFSESSLTSFIRVNAIPVFSPYNNKVENYCELENLPVCVFAFNVSDSSVYSQALKSAWKLNPKIVTARTTCEYNPEFCRYVGINKRKSHVVIMNRSIGTFWVHDLSDDVDAWVDDVMHGKVAGKGPGTRFLKSFWSFYYESKALGGFKYWRLFTPLVMGFLVVIIASETKSSFFVFPFSRVRRCNERQYVKKKPDSEPVSRVTN